MKTFRKILAITLVLATVLTLTSCGKKRENHLIGILQYTTDSASNTATEGFKQAVIKKLGAENLIFDYQSASGNEAVSSVIAKSFADKDASLIVANGDLAVKASVNAVTDIPVFGICVKNPDDYSKDNTFLTTDIVTYDDIMKTIQSILFPEAESVAVLYSSADITKITSSLESISLNVTALKLTDENPESVIATACESDFIFIPKDDAILPYTSTINTVSLDKKTPVFTTDKQICAECGTFALATDYYDLGYQAGLTAVEVLDGEADISELAVNYHLPDFFFNKANCKALSLNAPDGYKEV